MGIDFETTQKCVDKSFGNEDPASAKDNVFLREDYVYQKKSGVRFLPELMINQVVYKGQLDPRTVFNAICANFKDKPQVCVD